MKNLKLFLLLLPLLVLTSCPVMSYKHSFRFNNNSAIDIYAYLGVADRSFGGTLYPDTGVAEVRCGRLFKKGALRSYSYNYMYDKGDTEILSLFVFDADTFDKYNGDEIKNNYKILVRYDLSLKDLKGLNWEVCYPPDERMRGIKMYPPYSSTTITDTNKI